ncbi:voltage-gated potassium channel [Rhodobium orientis]|uniref:Cyclic nucleotide-binding protein n=1 Tax=Rhodobium orientis TaxID=34017 RepID=A0A327JMB5_9HYPH|nr:cyclic nucleotide-gated ion channel [Rhodobium orientis]MBB4301796.1 voltage-gated potassium channel [Rhodobium orientis]MBK5950595.1 cyclic nucleotide-binding protein [Rhodobium orientis]RAI24568.1 cyclic nucleotide-binding protein [Rhodobium orientis]
MAGRTKQRVFEILEEGAAGDSASHFVDRMLALLVILNVGSVVLETVPAYGERYRQAFLVIELVSLFVFTVEYVLRLWTADQHGALRHLPSWLARLRYMAYPAAIVDLLAILPLYALLFFETTDLRALLLFRLVRFLKLARFSPGLASLGNAVISERRALVGSLIIIMGVVLTSATVLYIAERTIQPEAFGSIPAAMWWAIATLTTVGYGDVVPVTTFGKVVAGIVMLTGYAMFALPIGIVATAFAREIHQRDFVVTWGMVARVPLFASMSAAEIAEVMKLLRAQRVEKGAIISRAGEDAHSMYFIASGRVRVELPNQTFELSDGAFFGEIAVLKRTARSAHMTALSICNLLALDAADLHVLMDRNPTIGAHIRKVVRERIGEEIVTPGGDLTEEEIRAARKASDDPDD